MESAKPAEECSVWQTIVGPVFEGAWPIDAELQTSRATFKLVQLLLATGQAFAEAAPVIIPFIRPEDRRAHSSVFSISEADPEVYGIAPDQMLNLLAAVGGDAPNGSLYGMGKALEEAAGEGARASSNKSISKTTDASDGALGWSLSLARGIQADGGIKNLPPRKHTFRFHSFGCGCWI